MNIRTIIDRAGGPAKVARLLGLKSHTAVLKWKKIPDHRIVPLEEATGIPREELRPDLFKRTPTEEVRV